MKIIRKEKKKMKLRSAKYVKFNLQVLINTAINYNLRGCVTLTVCSPIITKYSFWIWINFMILMHKDRNRSQLLIADLHAILTLISGYCPNKQRKEV